MSAKVDLSSKYSSHSLNKLVLLEQLYQMNKQSIVVNINQIEGGFNKAAY